MADHIFTYHVGAPKPIKFYSGSNLYPSANDYSYLLTAGNGSQIMMPETIFFMTTGRLRDASWGWGAVDYMKVVCGDSSIEATLGELVDGGAAKCNCVGSLTAEAFRDGIIFIPNVQAMQNGDWTRTVVYDVYAACESLSDFLQPNYFEVYWDNLKHDDFSTCASHDKPAHIARITYDPATGFVTVNTGFARRLKKNERCNGEDDITVVAPYRWCGGALAGYTEYADPEPGQLIFPRAKNSGRLQQGESIAEAKARLASDTVGSVESREYIADADGQYYWRNEASDGAATYIPVTVMQCLHPLGLLPTTENRLYRRRSESVGEGYPVVIYPKACETDTPTVTQLLEFSAKALAIRGGTFQYQVLTIGNYIANSHYELQPYLIDTGRTVTTTFDDGVVVETTVWYEMSSFPGAAYSMSCYVPDYAHTGETTRVVSAYLTAPQMDKYGIIINDDPIAVRCLDFLTFQYNDLYYIAGRVDTPTGYVFSDFVIAEAWMLSPCVSALGYMVYTRNEDGERDLSVYYVNSDFTGGTTAVASRGSGIYAITGTSGKVYYSSAHGEIDPATLF